MRISKVFTKFSVLLSLWLFVTSYSFAQQLQLTGKEQGNEITQSISYLIDEQSKLNVDQVAKLNSEFNLLNSQQHFIGNISGSVWLKLNVVNKTQYAVVSYIEYPYNQPSTI